MAEIWSKKEPRRTRAESLARDTAEVIRSVEGHAFVEHVFWAVFEVTVVDTVDSDLFGGAVTESFAAQVKQLSSGDLDFGGYGLVNDGDDFFGENEGVIGQDVVGAGDFHGQISLWAVFAAVTLSMTSSLWV